MKYKLIGIDLDGTLLNPQGAVSDANQQAVAALQEARACVVPCTARGWREARAVLDNVLGLDLGVFVTGANVSDMTSGTCLDFIALQPDLVSELIEFLDNETNTILCFRESSRVGHDYLVTGKCDIDNILQSWFDASEAIVCTQEHLTDEDLCHVLRIGLIIRSDTVPAIAQQIHQHYGDRVFAHSYPALNMPNSHENLYIVEIFAKDVDKWRGISWIAAQRGISHDHIAVIGDQINDLAMIRSAGCGIAMGNAIAVVQQAATYQTRSNADDGVAYAINQMLDEKW